MGTTAEHEGRTRRVVVAAFPNAQLLDVAGPCDVFATVGHAPRPAGEGGYAVEVVSTTPDLTIETSCGVAITARRSFAAVRGPIDTLLVAGATGLELTAQDAPFLRWLRRVAPRIRRVGSVCTGAFALAAAGLLDGRRATTHWACCGRLSREYPRVTVDPDPIFVRDGKVYTSAGVTAGTDLALALVEEDLGRDAALWVARDLVMFVRRPGGQAQFSALLDLQAADRDPLRDLQAWVAEHLADDLSVDALAERVHLSPRQFARVFAKAVGSTPARYVERVRVDAARRRLEESDAGLDRVARECGFGSADSMRRSFLRVLKVAPSGYRGRFRPAATGPSDE